MSPPTREEAGVAGVVERIRAWAKRPTVDATLDLLLWLREADGVQRSHVDAVARGVVERHGTSQRALVALGRLQARVGALPVAQQTLVNAGRLDSGARAPYVYLGEVLLRRGDPARALRMLERAAAMEPSAEEALAGDDDDVEAWLIEARSVGAVPKPKTSRTAVEAEKKAPGGGVLITEAPTTIGSLDENDDRPLIRRVGTGAKSAKPSDDSSSPPRELIEMTDEPTLPRNGARKAPVVDIDGDAEMVTTATDEVPFVPSAPSAVAAVAASYAPSRGVPTSTGSSLAGKVVPSVPASIASDETRPSDDALDAPWPTDELFEALGRAGIFEADAAATSPAQWAQRSDLDRPKRRGKLAYAGLSIAVVGTIVGLIVGGTELKRRHQEEARQSVERAASEVEQADVESLVAAEADIGHALELDSRTIDGARVWLRDRVVRSYVWPTTDRHDGGLASAIERGKTVGLVDEEMGYARLALALTSDDTASSAVLARDLEKKPFATKDDAWRALTVGWTLERAGDRRAFDAYARAIELDKNLVPARLSLAKGFALGGAIAKVDETLATVGDAWGATRDDLRALAALVGGAPSRPAGKDDAPRPGGFGWIGPTLRATAADLTDDVRKQLLEDAFAHARDPLDLTRIGRTALAVHADEVAGRVALRALEVSPIFVPARALAARLGLSRGRPDDAARALEGVAVDGDPEIAALRGWLAYERGDVAGVGSALADPSLAAGALDRVDVQSIVKPLRAVTADTALDADGALALAHLGELGPFVAFDLALDDGDIELARKIAAPWVAAEPHPAEAVRLSRLARADGKSDDADRYSRIAVEQASIAPRALVERVLVLCALGKGDDAVAMLARFSLLAPEEQPWLRAYATAQSGKTGDARRMVAAQPVPTARDPWPVRRDALLALAAVGDSKVARPLAKSLLAERPKDPDVVRASRLVAP